MNLRHYARSTRSRRLMQKLSAYAAGGVALVAGDASAAIVYTDLGVEGVTIFREMMPIDLDEDGSIDFDLRHERLEITCTYSQSFCYSHTTWLVTVYGASGNGVISKPPGGEAHRFTSGELITTLDPAGPRKRLAYGSDLFDANPHTSGEFFERRGFVGLNFSIDGEEHVAWADVEVLPFVAAAKLFSFAYETEPGKPILAGDTGATENIPGDTNGDFRVDIIDLNNVRNNFGATGDGVLGDTDGDDTVNIEDLNAVRNNFGAGNPVPEPPSLVLLAAGAAGLALLRRKRTKHELR